MATRATYTIDGMNFYCHWDGYPAGAAARFVNMVEAMTTIEDDSNRTYSGPFQDRRGGAQFAFIRGNMDAERAHPGGHGDTEFHYEVWTAENGRLHLHYKERSGKDWRGVDTVTLAKFCNRNGAKFGLPKLVEMREKAWGGAGPGDRYTIATLPIAEIAIERYTAQAQTFREDNPNRKECLKRAVRWREAIALTMEHA